MNVNKKGWIRSTLIAAFSLSIGLSSTAQANDRESIVVLSILKAYIENQGLECRGRAHGRRLSEGDYYDFHTTLYTGNTYAIIGAGDSNVKDLDIVLVDENGNQIDTDQDYDSTPVVKVSPSWSGEYTIRVRMYRGSGHSNVMVCYQ